MAVYKPDPSAITQRSKGKDYGLIHKGNYLQVVSKEPVRLFDEKACLQYLLEKEDEKEENALWREKARASKDL